MRLLLRRIQIPVLVTLTALHCPRGRNVLPGRFRSAQKWAAPGPQEALCPDQWLVVTEPSQQQLAHISPQFSKKCPHLVFIVVFLVSPNSCLPQLLRN